MAKYKWHQWAVGIVLAPFVFPGFVIFVLLKHGFYGAFVYLRILYERCVSRDT